MLKFFSRVIILMSLSLLLFATTGTAQTLVAPATAEAEIAKKRLQRIMSSGSDPGAVKRASCALDLLRGESPKSDECKKWAGKRATRAARRRRAKRIVNGVATHAHPSAGALIKGLSSDSASIHCSGTLIAPDKFLTAAHCIAKNQNPGAYWVFFQHAGIFDVGAIEWPKKEYAAKDDAADIAVLTLKTSIATIRPTPFNDTAEIIEGTEGTIIGFGRTGGTYKGGDKEDYGIKRLGYVKTGKCKSTLAKNAHLCWNFSSVLEGVQLRSNTCNADSGGGLINASGRTFVIGVTTAGDRDNCDLGDHSWDVNVYRWKSWISERVIGTTLTKSHSRIFKVVDPDRHVVGDTRRISDKIPELSYKIDVLNGTNRLAVAMNGEDDGNGTNDFDLYLIAKDTKDLSKAACKRSGLGQFAYCQIDRPAPGPWRIVVRRKQGEGLVQVTVTRMK